MPGKPQDFPGIVLFLFFNTTPLFGKRHRQTHCNSNLPWRVIAFVVKLRIAHHTCATFPIFCIASFCL